MSGTRWEATTLLVMSLVVWMLSAAAVLVSAQGQDSGSGAANNQAQIDKGRQAVGEICAACHNNIMRMISIHRKSANQ